MNKMNMKFKIKNQQNITICSKYKRKRNNKINKRIFLYLRLLKIIIQIMMNIYLKRILIINKNLLKIKTKKKILLKEVKKKKKINK